MAKKKSNRSCLGTILIFPFALVESIAVTCFSLVFGLIKLVLESIKSAIIPKRNMTGLEYEHGVAPRSANPKTLFVLHCIFYIIGIICLAIIKEYQALAIIAGVAVVTTIIFGLKVFKK